MSVLIAAVVFVTSAKAQLKTVPDAGAVACVLVTAAPQGAVLQSEIAQRSVPATLMSNFAL